jgi:hypothetical protein
LASFSCSEQDPVQSETTLSVAAILSVPGFWKMNDQLANLSPVTVVGFIMRFLRGGISMQLFTSADERVLRANWMGAKREPASLYIHWAFRNSIRPGFVRHSLVAEKTR